METFLDNIPQWFWFLMFVLGVFGLIIATGLYIARSDAKHRKRKPIPPWVKSTPEGALYVDTSHPEWQEWFQDYIEKNKGRIKISKNQIGFKLPSDGL